MQPWGDFDQGQFDWTALSTALPSAYTGSSASLYGAALGLANGHVLRVLVDGGSDRVLIQRVTDPGSQSGWESAAFEKSYTNTSLRPAAAAMWADGGVVRVGLSASSGIIYASHVSGAWSTGFSSYSGWDTAAQDLFSVHSPVLGQMFFGTTASRELIVGYLSNNRITRFARGPAGWRYVGAQPHPTASSCKVYLLLDRADAGNNPYAYSRIGVATVSASGWSAVDVIEELGENDTIYTDLARAYPHDRGGLLWLQEQSGLAYDAVAAIEAATDFISEPVIQPGWPGRGLLDKNGLTLVDAGGTSYFVGANFAARMERRAQAPLQLPTPRRYSYSQAIIALQQLTTDRALGSGRMVLEWNRAPAVKPGDLLIVERSHADRSGRDRAALPVYLWVAEVERRRDKTTVTALDPVALLGWMRLRRPATYHVLPRWNFGRIVQHLIARAGLSASTELAQTVQSVNTFQVHENENLRSALYRSHLVSEYLYYRPNPDAGTLAIRIIAGATVSGGAAYAYGGQDGQPLLDDELIDSALPFSLAIVEGQYRADIVAGDPRETSWALRRGPRRFGVRPRPTHYVNRGQLVDSQRIVRAAQSTAAQLRRQDVVRRVLTVANLGLEIYDQVSVDDALFQVVGILETWDQGRLYHELSLAPPEPDKVPGTQTPVDPVQAPLTPPARISVFDSRVTAATPGIPWLATTSPAVIAADNIGIVTSSTSWPAAVAPTAVAASYVSASPAYVVRFVLHGHKLRWQMHSAQHAHGDSRGPAFTTTAKSNLILAIRLNDGRIYQWDLSILTGSGGDTTEPYNWLNALVAQAGAANDEALRAAVASATSVQSVLLDRAHANVDGPTLTIASLT